MYYIAGVSAVPSAQPTQRRRQRCTPASDAASAPWGDLGRRGFLSGSYISKGGSSSSGSSGGASEGIGSVITAALRGLGGGGSSGALAAAVNGAGAADAGLLAEGLEHGQAAWAARMRFRRQEPTFQVGDAAPHPGAAGLHSGTASVAHAADCTRHDLRHARLGRLQRRAGRKACRHPCAAPRDGACASNRRSA
jgi:hypothetical protein